MSDPAFKKKLFTGRLAALEAQLPSCVSEAKNGVPLAEVWVIVPNQLTRLHLRRVLARALGVVANVQLMTMHELMQRIASPVLLREKWRTMPESVVDPLLSRVIERCGKDLRYLNTVARSRGFRSTLVRTRQELIFAQLRPDDLNRVYFGPQERADKIRDLILLCNEYENECATLKLFDRATLQQIALTAAHEPRDFPPLILYAPFDWPVLTRDVLTEVLAAAKAQALLPWVADDSDFAFTSALQQWFTEQNFDHCALVDTATRPTAHFVEAPGDSAVAVEIMRDILYSDAQHARDCAVALPPNAAIVANALETQCDLIPLTPYIYQSKSLRQSRAGRGFAALANLLLGDFELALMREFWNAVPLKDTEAADVGLWNRLASDARVQKSAASWRTGLARLKERLIYERDRLADKGEDEEAQVASIGRQIIQIERCVAAHELLFSAIQSARSAKTWQIAVAGIWEYYSQVAVIDENFADITVQLEQCDLLDLAKLPPTPAELRDFLQSALETPGERVGVFGRSAPTIAPREQFIGARCHHVYLPGFNEGTLPHVDRQDPLLLDDDREEINQALKTTLSKRGDWPSRERYYLTMLLDSAQSSLTIYVARADTEGRPQLVAPYATEILKARHPDAPLAADFKALAELDKSHCRSVPANPVATVDTAMALHASEYHRLALGQALRTRTLAPLRHALTDNTFRQALDAERARFATNTFTAYDGLLSNKQNLAALQTRYDGARPLSPTRLENYWLCSYRYFLQYELGVYAPEEVDTISPVNGLDRGQILHEILQRYHEARIGREFAIENYPWDALAQLTNSTIKAHLRRLGSGSRYLAAQLEREMLSKLKSYHDNLVQPPHIRSTMLVECTFGFGEERFPDPVRYVAPSGEFVTFAGRLDRWDSSKDERDIVVTDYKIGQKPKEKERRATRLLQLGVYNLVAEHHYPEASIRSRYLYFKGGQEDIALGSDELVDRLNSAVHISTDMRHGIFVPEPDDGKEHGVCATCPVKLACGAQRHAEKPITPHSVAGLRTLRAPNDAEEGEVFNA